MVVDCPNCGKENKNTNIKCEFCSKQLIDINEFNQPSNVEANDSVVETHEVKYSTKQIGCLTNILISIFVGPWLLAGILFLGTGLFYSISEYNQTKEYEQTTAVLKDFTNCTYNDDCEAIYEYQVNGITYTVSPDSSSNRDGFKERDTVYYNPNNPSESIMYAGWGTKIITGVIIISVVVAIFVLKKFIIKKISKGKENITMACIKTNKRTFWMRTD